MATIYVDGRQYEVSDGVNLLHACLSLGLDLPYFCWHPALGSVGACRQCAVTQFKDETDTHGKLVMACMTPATPNARISIDAPAAREFRQYVGEWLMVHHPHDCPVCDEGGECHLQDMTVMDGHTYRRYRGQKRTFRNQDLGPFVNQEMNRCIQCYRCVRFYRDYAGGRDFDAHFLRDRVFFGRHDDGVLESEFSGNLVEVCPTGVFTDKTLKQHFTRKWDLRTAPSVCVNCSIGCNTIPGERYGMLRSIRARFNHAVNGYFLCDRGRYGYEFVNSDRRIRAPLAADADRHVGAVSPRDAVERAAGWLAGSRALGIGSPRASLEANFALRALVGPDRFCSGMTGGEQHLVATILDILRRGPAPSASLHDVERSDAVLVLGEDATNTAPMLALALRQSIRRQPMATAARLKIPEWDDAAVREAVQDAKGPFFIVSAATTRLDDIATATVRAAPDDGARIGFAIAHALDGDAPDPGAPLPADAALVTRIASALRDAAAPLIVAGTSAGSEAAIQAAANIAWALRRAGRPARVAFVVPECNSLGVSLLDGMDLDAAAGVIDRGEAGTVIVLENDLPRRGSEQAQLLEKAAHVVVIDHLQTPTAERADIVLPAATFAEGDGTLVNNEGRVQRSFQVFVPNGDVQESWRWIRDVAAAAGAGEAARWETLDDVVDAIAERVPALAAIRDAAPPASFRIAGRKIAREPGRYSGRTAKYAGITIREPKPPSDPDTPLTFTMEGFEGQPPPALIPRFWAPGWNSVQSVNFYQTEVGAPLRGGDPGKRAIEPVTGARPAYFDRLPKPSAPAAGEFLGVPLYHIFGSEELSMLSPGIAGRAPAPYVALNAADLQRAGLADGDEVLVTAGGRDHRAIARLIPSLPPGVAGVPAGLPAMQGIRLPAAVRVARAGA